jgi:dihydrofolate reductase
MMRWERAASFCRMPRSSRARLRCSPTVLGFSELFAHVIEELRAMGAFLNGRVTYELMAGFWPTADADPGSIPPVKEFARIWRDMPKVVYSKTLTSAGWNTTIARDVVRGEVEELKLRARGDLVVGGGDLAAAFMGQDLIDEYRIYVHPIQIGEGCKGSWIARRTGNRACRRSSSQALILAQLAGARALAFHPVDDPPLGAGAASRLTSGYHESMLSP